MSPVFEPPPPAEVFECGDCGADIVPMYTTQADLFMPLSWMHAATRQVQCHPNLVAHPAGGVEATAAAVEKVRLPADYWERHDDWPTLPERTK